MKILYISNHDLEIHSGVVSKIKSQVSEWRALGHEVVIFCPSTLKTFDSRFVRTHQFITLNRLLRLTWVFKFFFYHLFSLIIAEKVRPNLVYGRFFFFSPFLSILQIRYPFVFEINGSDNDELRGNNIWYIYNYLTRSLNYLAAKGFVFVSSELQHKYHFIQKSIVIPNGYSLPNYVPKDCHDFLRTGKVNVIFTGTEGQSWHGIDKVIPLISSSHGVHLHIIGYNGQNTSNITYYGKVIPEFNLGMVNGGDVCISSLALHRISISEACPLKSREYIWCEKRFIYAYDDPDIDPLSTKFPDFFLKLPNNEQNVSNYGNEILDFIKAKPVSEVLVFTIAKKQINYTTKEKERIEFFDRILND